MRNSRTTKFARLVLIDVNNWHGGVWPQLYKLLHSNVKEVLVRKGTCSLKHFSTHDKHFQMKLF